MTSTRAYATYSDNKYIMVNIYFCELQKVYIYIIFLYDYR